MITGQVWDGNVGFAVNPVGETRKEIYTAHWIVTMERDQAERESLRNKLRYGAYFDITAVPPKSLLADLARQNQTARCEVSLGDERAEVVCVFWSPGPGRVRAIVPDQERA